MARGVGEIAAVRAVPEVVVVLFAVVTQLGDAWFVLGVLSSLYWFGRRHPFLVGRIDRTDAAFLLALVLGGFGLTAGLKFGFGLPRPPGANTARGIGLFEGFPPLVRAIYRNFATADGFGFPSGHAVRSTLAWGGLALVLDAGTPGQRSTPSEVPNTTDGPVGAVPTVAAAVVVGLVAVSRVIIEVHYAVDVIAGVGVGAVFLIAMWRFVGPANPARAFSIAVMLSIGAVAVAGFERDPLAVLGATIGARVTWWAIGGALVEANPTRLAIVVAAAVSVPVLGALFFVAASVADAAAATVVASGVGLAVVLGLPLFADRLLDDRLRLNGRLDVDRFDEDR